MREWWEVERTGCRRGVGVEKRREKEEERARGSGDTGLDYGGFFFELSLLLLLLEEVGCTLSVRLCSLSVVAGCSSMGMKEREETKGE